MKHIRLFESLYFRFPFIFFLLLINVVFLVLIFSSRSSTKFFVGLDQELQKNLAQNAATGIKTFLNGEFKEEAIRDYFKKLQDHNPRIEPYLLDKNGNILLSIGDGRFLGRKHIDLFIVDVFIEKKNDLAFPIVAANPKSSTELATFSAAKFNLSNKTYYLYIILTNDDLSALMDVSRLNYRSNVIIPALGIIIVTTALAALLVFAVLAKRFRQMMHVIADFEDGDLSKRIMHKNNDEFDRIAQAFNDMADTIESNISELHGKDELRRETVSNISHDLRTPVAAVRGYLETIINLGDNLTEEKKKTCLETALNNTVSLQNLIDQLFELSKLEAGQKQAAKEIISLTSLIKGVIRSLSNKANKADIKLDLKTPEEMIDVHADPQMLERVFLNLVENGIHYCPEGSTISISLSSEINDVVVAVSDNGKGISSEELPHIFDRFYQAKSDVKSSSGGTGLGLAIVRHLLELHGSVISVKSEVDQGTSFTFRLPIHR